MKSRNALKKMFIKMPELDEKVVLLGRSLPGNITLEMGFSMYNLSQYEEILNSKSYDEIKSKLDSGDISAEFKRDWFSFIEEFGFRCHKEIDLQPERMWEKPEVIYNRLKQMSTLKESPQSVYEKSVELRKHAFEELLLVARGMGKEKAFKKNYDVLTTLGGYRETHKYCMVKAMDVYRREILKVARMLVAESRLKDENQIFDLKLDDIISGLENKDIDLIAIGHKNTEFMRRVAHVKRFPVLIDSRGRIPTPDIPDAEDNQLVGMAISPGQVKGRVKVLHSPDDKVVEPGEILVARATDPGWTPLFVNASGVVLEIGGMLQHGAQVAREYGKPCVCGIMNVTELLKDGQLIEVDGSNGVVTVLKQS